MGYDYESQVKAIDRRRQLAQLLSMKAMERQNPMRGAENGGYVVPVQPAEGIERLAQSLFGSAGQTLADNQERELARAHGMELSDAYGSGNMAKIMQADPEGGKEALLAALKAERVAKAGKHVSQVLPIVQGGRTMPLLINSDASQEVLPYDLNPKNLGQNIQPIAGPNGVQVQPYPFATNAVGALEGAKEDAQIENVTLPDGRVIPVRKGSVVPPVGSQPVNPENSSSAGFDDPAKALAIARALPDGHPDKAALIKAATEAQVLAGLGLGQSTADKARQQAEGSAPVELEVARQKAAIGAGQNASESGMKYILDRYSMLQDAPATLANIERAKRLVPDAKAFAGSLGETKLGWAKFFNDNLGMSINVEGVKSAEELRATMFTQIMDNLKKMDASPSQEQQRTMKDALGSLSTDPNAIPRVLDVFGDLIKNKVRSHNRIVDDAKKNGARFLFDPSIQIDSANEATPLLDQVPKGEAPELTQPQGTETKEQIRDRLRKELGM